MPDVKKSRSYVLELPGRVVAPPNLATGPPAATRKSPRTSHDFATMRRNIIRINKRFPNRDLCAKNDTRVVIRARGGKAYGV